ncbi:MAG TPA: NADH-quinone oxidoreductase subunit C [Anaeromyxobacteraceae bacterium]|nr:NADH-quinone oxidoreductase subunit C [Anaeromyxobacteraceae bacterium]
MVDAGALAAALEAAVPGLAGKVTVARARRVFCEPPPEAFRHAFDTAVGALGFDRLCAITGMDDRTSFAALYSLARKDGTVLSLRLRAPHGAPVIESVTDRFPGAANYERELVDLLGFTVRGLPPGKRYPLPDDWPEDQKPLRKDWKPAGAAAAPAAPAPTPKATS